MEAEKLLDLALKEGASHAEVYQVSSFSRPVFFEANRLKQLESSQATGCALRLWKDNRPGLAVAYGDVSAASLVAKAIALTALNEPETPELAESTTALYPQSGQILPVEKLVEIGKDAIALLLDAYPELLCSASLECEEETTTLINSQGLNCQFQEISKGYYLGVEMTRGEDFLSIYDGEYTKEHLEHTEVVKKIIERLDWAKSNVAPPTGKVPVLLTANATSLLWETIAAAMNSKQVLEKSSPWSEKLGELVMNPSLTLSQQPDFAPYDCPFDDEGTPTQSLSLIKQGRLEQFYSDRTTARILGKKSTGNGFRPSLSRYPTPDLINLVIDPGKGSLKELIQQIDEGIVIDQILGESADISGDFSINVDLGYRIKNGEILGRVKDTMVAGNVYTALKQVRQLGNDRSWNGSCYTPSLIVEELSVVG